MIARLLVVLVVGGTSCRPGDAARAPPEGAMKAKRDRRDPHPAPGTSSSSEAPPQRVVASHGAQPLSLVSLEPGPTQLCALLRQVMVGQAAQESGSGFALAPVGELRCGRLAEHAALQFQFDASPGHCHTVKAVAQPGTGLLELRVLDAATGELWFREGPAERVSMRPEAGACVRVPLAESVALTVELRAVVGSPLLATQVFRKR